MNQLKDRGFQLSVAALIQHIAHGLGNLGALEHNLTSLIAHHQIEVALTHAGFIVQLRVKVRHGAQCLGSHLPGVRHDGELTAARRNHLTVNKDVVTQVNQGLPVSQRLFAHTGQRNHGLNTGSITLLQRGKAELAGIAHKDHTAGDTHQLTGRLVCLQLAIILLANLGDSVRYRHTHRVGLTARFKQFGALVQADLHLL